LSIERDAPQPVTTPEPLLDERAVLALVGLDPVAALITLDILSSGGGERPC
jgi:hypothetical protein